MERSPLIKWEDHDNFTGDIVHYVSTPRQLGTNKSHYVGMFAEPSVDFYLILGSILILNRVTSNSLHRVSLPRPTVFYKLDRAETSVSNMSDDFVSLSLDLDCLFKTQTSHPLKLPYDYLYLHENSDRSRADKDKNSEYINNLTTTVPGFFVCCDPM